MLRTSNNNVIIVDDFIPLSLQEHYKTLLLKGNFPWYYTHDVTSAGNEQFRPALSHLIYDNGQKISPVEIDLLAHLGAAKFGWTFNNIVQAKTILQFPLNPGLLGEEEDSLHVDIEPFMSHLVVLYYVIDADGDTIITDVKCDGKGPGILKFNNQHILHQVTPKQGRAVLFDGRYFHTAQQPKNGMRCIININVF